MEKLLKDYALNDGEIISLKINAAYTFNSEPVLRQASVELLIRKRARNAWMPCVLQIELDEILSLRLNEDFASPRYSDIVFKRIEDDRWYLSLDPYGNSGEPHEEDNLVIVAKSVKIDEGVTQDRF
ncbi:hypothetical protein [Hymenobacter glacieicola]|uniref:DUF1883 domain-containing protein n=1 Tax=Hymenobacter glacieicola TaxID=1562124 RepID=A0ABQ1WDQ7_9BACT|nr:hypothetical protein [Hymenobacter glacieicola]GGG27574.1 hypothetical protein GCM10011378_00500 [Hymenobacter glacieicola]